MVYGQDGSPRQRKWRLVGEETDSKWKCECSMEDTGRPTAFRKDGDEGRKLMKFKVARE